MANQPRSKRPMSYAWALLPQVANRGWRLRTVEEEKGLEWAMLLATAHLQRGASFLPRKGQPLRPIPRLTVAQLAWDEQQSPVYINLCIHRARLAMFGELTDAGIYSRKRRWNRLASPARERCAENDCGRVARQASPRRRGRRPIYCETHGSGRARTERCRRLN